MNLTGRCSAGAEHGGMQSGIWGLGRMADPGPLFVGPGAGRRFVRRLPARLRAVVPSFPGRRGVR